MKLTTLLLVISALPGVWLAYGFFALWISSRSWHWFFQLAILIASVTPLIAIEAPDLMLAVLVCNLTMFFPIAYSRATQSASSSRSQESDLPPDSRDRSQLLRWGLTDLFLATALIAVVVMLFQVDLTGQDVSVLMAILFGSSVGASFLIGVAAIYGPWSWRRRVATCAVLLAVAGSLSVGFMVSAVQTRQASTLGDNFVSCAQTISWVAGAFMLVSLLALRTQWGDWKPKPLESKFWDRVRSIQLTFFCLLIAGMLIMCLVSLPLTYSKLLTYYPVAAEDNPQTGPNGFLELLDAGQTLSQSTVLEGVTLSLPGPQLRQEVKRYQSTFASVETALNCELLTAKTWSISNPQPILEGNSQSSTNIRSVARALSNKSRQETHDGNFNIAIEDGCQCLKLRIPLSRSGLIVDALFGLALESIALTPIQNATAGASAEKLREALAVLKEMDALPDDAKWICQQEKEEMWRHHNWKQRLSLWLTEDIYETLDHNLKHSFRRHCVLRRQLTISIALELFRRDQQRYPQVLSDLVPQYLDSIPQDPFASEDSDGSFKYALEKDGQTLRLYSIGPNGVDDGGQLNEMNYWDIETGDINFREWVRISNEEYRSFALAELKAAKENGLVEPVEE